MYFCFQWTHSDFVTAWRACHEKYFQNSAPLRGGTQNGLHIQTRCGILCMEVRRTFQRISYAKIRVNWRNWLFLICQVYYHITCTFGEMVSEVFGGFCKIQNCRIKFGVVEALNTIFMKFVEWPSGSWKINLVGTYMYMSTTVVRFWILTSWKPAEKFHENSVEHLKDAQFDVNFEFGFIHIK